MKHFFNHIDDSGAITAILQITIDNSTLEMDRFRDARINIERLRKPGNMRNAANFHANCFTGDIS